MVLYLFCRLFFALQGEKTIDRGNIRGKYSDWLAVETAPVRMLAA